MTPITFTSPLSKKDIYLTMKNLTNTNADKPLFVGAVTEDGFSVMKYRLFQRNEFFSRNVLDPQFNAVVTEDNNGTKITIKATLTKMNKIGTAMPVFAFGNICANTCCASSDLIRNDGFFN